MSVRIYIFHLCGLLLLASTSCDSKPARTQQSPPPQKSTATSASSSEHEGVAFDACALLTPAEVAALMGQPVKETKSSKPSSNQTDPFFERWQCFYTAERFDASVSLEITRNNPKGDQNALVEFWKTTFREAKDTRKAAKPKAVPGVGDEAFLVGDSKTGTLYVLKNNSYLRISIGGQDEDSVRVEKLKALAKNALKRL